MHFSDAILMFRYGYLTNTKVKFILVTTDLDVRDADVRDVSAYFRLYIYDSDDNTLA